MADKKFNYYEPPGSNKPKKTDPIVDIYDDDDDDEHGSEISAIFKWKMKNSPIFPLVPIGNVFSRPLIYHYFVNNYKDSF